MMMNMNDDGDDAREQFSFWYKSKRGLHDVMDLISEGGIHHPVLSKAMKKK